MNWNRVMHVAGGVAAFVVAVGPTLIPIVPPTVGAVVGVAIAIAANWDKIRGARPKP